MAMADAAALIGIDWGTTSFRAYRIAADGRVLETRTAAAGILKVEGGAFEAVLEREIGAWLAAAPARAGDRFRHDHLAPGLGRGALLRLPGRRGRACRGAPAP